MFILSWMLPPSHANCGKYEEGKLIPRNLSFSLQFVASCSHKQRKALSAYCYPNARHARALWKFIKMLEMKENIFLYSINRDQRLCLTTEKFRKIFFLSIYIYTYVAYTHGHVYICLQVWETLLQKFPVVWNVKVVQVERIYFAFQLIKVHVLY
jgi:hypothetical protein